MAPSRPRLLGMDVHQETMAVAYGAHEPGAAGPARGTSGTRQGDLAPRVHPRPSHAPPLRCVSAAGPWGSWLSRSRRQTGDASGGVAPSLLPQQPGARGTTDRREARPRARRARAGDLPTVSVPQGAAEALRALTRARADARSDLPDAQRRRKALVLRHARREGGRAKGGRAPLRWRSALGCVLPRRRPALCKPPAVRCRSRPNASSVSPRPGTRPAQPGGCPPGSRPSRPGVGGRARSR